VLAAVLAGSRAVLETLIGGQVVSVRSEMESLRAGRLQSDARARRLSQRVGGWRCGAGACWATTRSPSTARRRRRSGRSCPYGVARRRKHATCVSSSWAAWTAAASCARAAVEMSRETQAIPTTTRFPGRPSERLPRETL